MSSSTTSTPTSPRTTAGSSAIPNVRFHFTPTRASWLNQVEIWFSILQDKSLHGASFTSVAQLREHIDAFIDAYNENAHALRLDQNQGPSASLQGPPYQSIVIPGTSDAPDAGSFAQYEKTRLVMKLRGARERDPDLVIAAKRLHWRSPKGAFCAGTAGDGLQ